MTIRVHRGDLPDLSHYRGGAVAIDTETMGLDPSRDRLCVVQLSPGDGTADVVQIPAGASEAPNLTKLLADGSILKIFHFARFDLGVLQKRLAVMPTPGLLHQDRLAARPHLYRQAWAQGSRARSAGHRRVEAAAVLRLGRRCADRRAGRLRRLRRAASACPEGDGSTPCSCARDARTSRRPAFASCRTGCGSTSPAGRRRIFLPTPRVADGENVRIG